jgi:hypothetical protein
VRAERALPITGSRSPTAIATSTYWSLGPQAPVAVRDEAWAILDSLRIDAHVRSDWRSSG